MLMGAAAYGREAVVAALLKAGASVDLQCSDGYTALMYAIQQGHVAVAAALLQRGAVNLRNSERGTALMGQAEVVAALLQWGASVDVQTNLGIVAANLGRWRDARRHFDKATKLTNKAAAGTKGQGEASAAGEVAATWMAKVEHELCSMPAVRQWWEPVPGPGSADPSICVAPELFAIVP